MSAARTSRIARPPRRRQRGTTLLEALVAFLVLSLGMLTVARFQTQLRLNSDVARQRSEAVRIAQQEMENLRSFSVMAITAGARSFGEISSGATTLDEIAEQAGSNTRYTLTRSVSDGVLPNAKTASLSVAWDDRSGGAQKVVLETVIAAIDPAYSGALGVAPNNAVFKGAFARSAHIPLLAKDLGDGSSVFKPVGSGSVALVFDNRSGLVTRRCTGVATTISTASLTPADLLGCDASVGQLLSGRVRFTAASPPDPARANDIPPGFGINVSLSGGTYPLTPQCTTEAQKAVRVMAADGGTRILTVAASAAPASLGFAGWQETGERFAAYHCVVYPLANGQWSGRTTLVPADWTIGGASTDWRVCRFSADLDGSGAVDANAEHPSAYSAVDAPLANQNFLVVKGNEACPVGAAVRIEGGSGDIFVSLATAPHQP